MYAYLPIHTYLIYLGSSASLPTNRYVVNIPIARTSKFVERQIFVGRIGTSFNYVNQILSTIHR